MEENSRGEDLKVEFRPKILIVDDDLQMLGLLGNVLSQMGAEPHCVASSPQAAELITRHKFDGMFLDSDMPEMTGVELAERKRAKGG